MPEGSHADKENNGKADRATDFPKVTHILLRVCDAAQVHAVVRREEGEREEDDGDAREDEDRLVLAVGDDAQLGRFDGAELEEGVEGSAEVDKQSVEALRLGRDRLLGPGQAFEGRFAVRSIGRVAHPRIFRLEPSDVLLHGFEQPPVLVKDERDGCDFVDAVQVVPDKGDGLLRLPFLVATAFEILNDTRISSFQARSVESLT